jgi:membrane protein implicated in regulation of membrane protease activity
MDNDKRAEWTLMAVQTATLLVILLVAIAVLQPSISLGIFLSCSCIFLICYRSWAIDRFAPSSAGIYARIFVTEFLDELIHYAHRCPACRTALGRATEHVDALARADGPARADAASILRGAGYPARSPIPVVSLLTSVISFAVGAFFGAWLPTTSLSAAFTPLCNAGGIAQVLVAPFRLATTAPVLLILVTVLFGKLVVAQRNRTQIKRAGDTIRESPHEELEGILTGPFQQRRRALISDLTLLAQAIGARPEQAKAILEMYGSEAADATSPRLSWRTFRLSTVNELSKNQVMFVFGLYLGLALPDLLHFAGPACS